jgi:hypothetical protein
MVVGYMGMLIAAALAAPGVGVLGEIIVWLPYGALDWLHVPAFGLLTWLAIRGLQRRGWPLPYALGTGMFGSFVFGLWIEVCQGSVEGRTTSSEDLFINTVSIIAAGVMLAGWTAWSRALPQAALRTPIAD